MFTRTSIFYRNRYSSELLGLQYVLSDTSFNLKFKTTFDCISYSSASSDLRPILRHPKGLRMIFLKLDISSYR
jgi:hypothetical protein